MTLDDWATRQAVADKYHELLCDIIKRAIRDVKNVEINQKDREDARRFLLDDSVLALIEEYIGETLANLLPEWVKQMTNKPCYTFTITGKIKPAVRMTNRSKWVNGQAREYLASKDAVAWQLKQQMAESGWEMLPGQTPLFTEIRLTAPTGLHRSDFDNIIKAAHDSANGIVYPDDRWIDAHQFERRKGTEYRAEFVVGVL